MKKSPLLSILLLLLLVFSCKDDDKFESNISVNKGISSISANNTAHNLELDIESDFEWKVSTSVDWIEFDETKGNGNGTLELTLLENTLYQRSAIIRFECENQIFDFEVKQEGKDIGTEGDIHHFYVTFGSLPSLYAGLHVLTHSDPSYFFFYRGKTYDTNLFPQHVHWVVTGDDEVQEEMRNNMKARILEINKANPQAKFCLYVDDLRARIGYDWFTKQGIDASRITVTLLSDGSGSYDQFYQRYGTSVEGEERWKNVMSELEELHNVTSTDTRSLPEFESWDWPWCISTYPNYKYYIQDGTLLETDDAYVRSQMPKMNLVNIAPLDILQSLSVERKDTFYKMVRFDYEEVEKELNASPKKNLIIIGTNPSNVHDTQIKLTMEKYSSEYDVFYSPHPVDPYFNDYETRYPGLKLLMTNVPFEVFLWSFMDEVDLIGGAPSTVFLTAPIEKVGFMYAASAASMPKPLDKTMGSASDIIWMP